VLYLFHFPKEERKSNSCGRGVVNDGAFAFFAHSLEAIFFRVEILDLDFGRGFPLLVMLVAIRIISGLSDKTLFNL
jgi:hypothetical protein